jgi:ubiquitin-protein ligase
MSESDNYTSEIQTKRIDKGRFHIELQLLAQLPPGFTVSHSDSPFGLIIQVTVSVAAFPTDLDQDLIFEIHIEGKFPFQAPKIQCKTAFLQPSLADGRDLLRDIIGAQWTPSLTMNQLVSQIPSFAVLGT